MRFIALVVYPSHYYYDELEVSMCTWIGFVAFHAGLSIGFLKT